MVLNDQIVSLVRLPVKRLSRRVVVWLTPFVLDISHLMTISQSSA